jgi:putative DNA primase/helicase
MNVIPMDQKAGPFVFPVQVDPIALPREDRLHFASDVGFSDSFVAAHGDKVRFVHEEGTWLIFCPRRGWSRESASKVVGLYGEFARGLYEESLKTAGGLSPEEGARRIKQAAELGKLHRVSPAIEFTKVHPRISVSSGDLDQDAFLLGAQNGVVNLKSGVFMPHNPALMVTRRVACDFDPTATCPVFERFMEEVQPDPEVRAFLQRLCGYALTGSMGEHIVPFSYGLGANGKSTLWEQVIYPMMGSYAVKLTDSLIYASKSGREPHLEIAGLCGKRFALGEENADGGNLNEALLKSLSGGDWQKGKFHYQDFFEFSPTAKVFLVGNHRPRINGRDDGIWRRFRLVDWPVQIPEEKRDQALPLKLRDEFSGILNWCIKGALALGEKGTLPPASVRESTAKFREDSDSFGEFLRATTIDDAEGFIPKGELYSLYKDYCLDADIKSHFTLNKVSFGKRIMERGYFEGKHKVGGNMVHAWRGLTRRSGDE